MSNNNRIYLRIIWLVFGFVDKRVRKFFAMHLHCSFGFRLY